MATTISRLAIALGLDPSGMKKGTIQAQGMLEGLRASVARIGASLAVFAGGASLLGSAGWGIKLASDAEQASIALGVLVGDGARATAMLAEMRDFAAKTPLGFNDMTKAAQTMLAFGAAAEEIMPNLRMLGDISMGNADRFQSLVLAFSQVQASGRLMGQDLLQLINAGFNPLQIISKQTGESLADLKKKMEEGQISFEDVRGAMQSATSSGGIFAGMMEKMGESLGGKWGQLKDKAAQLAQKMGEVLVPALGTLMDGFSRVLDATIAYVEESGPVLSAFFDLLAHLAVSFLDNVVIPVINGMTWIAKQVRELLEEFGIIEKQAKATSDKIKKTLTPPKVDRSQLLEDFEAAKQKMDELRERGEALTKSLRTPLEVLHDELKDVNELFVAGAINQQTFSRQLDKLAEDFRAAIEVKMPNLSIGVGAATRDSTAGFSAVHAAQREIEERRRAEAARKAQHETTNQILKEQLDAIRNIPKVATVSL